MRGMLWDVQPKSKTLNPKHQTPNPKPQTLNSQPSTYTPHPKLSTRNPKTKISKFELETQIHLQVMQSLEELWDEEKYNEEVDASSFLAALPSKP